MSIQKVLNRNGITSIWHFTDRSNLSSILECGILSLKEIKRENVNVSRYGANELSHDLDASLGLDKFVHLSFIQDHPMYHNAKSDGRIADPVWVEIDVLAIDEQKTLFSNRYANSRGAKIFNADDLEKEVDFDAILHERDFWKRVEARKAEVMVLEKIDPKYIIGVYNGN